MSCLARSAAPAKTLKIEGIRMKGTASDVTLRSHGV